MSGATAEYLTDAAAFGVTFAGMDQLFEVFRGNVEEGFKIGQRSFQVLGIDCLIVGG
ncbi:hypothetical protein D3C87_2207560 [compost metagenome]